MKKIIAILLAAVLVLGFVGCAKKDSSTTTAATTEKAQNTGINIVCTIFPQYDFMRAITKGVDGVNLKMLLAPGDESHSYSATLEDIAAIDGADLFIYVGGESDEWVKEVLKTASPKKTIALTDLVKTLEESDEGILAKEEEAEEEPAADEHVWTSLENTCEIIHALSQTMSEIDGKHADVYTANADAYIKEFSNLDAKFVSLFAGVKNKTIVIADRNPFRYFCEEYGIKAIAAFAGCSSNNEIPLAVQNDLIKAIQENGLKYVFVIELNNSDYADYIAAQTGAQKLTLNSCHNLSKENFESGKTFLELMSENYDTLSKALA